MGIGIIEVNHVNVTVPAALEQAAKHFYGTVLGLRQIQKPEGTRQYVGAWFELGGSNFIYPSKKTSRTKQVSVMFVIRLPTLPVRNSIFAMQALQSSRISVR